MLYTYETGNAGNEAILFLHAGGLGGQSWLPVIEHLPDFHCLAPDLPEQGRSKDVPYSINASVNALIQIIRDRVPGQKAHVVALSLGGPVAFSLLRADPELIDSVIISGGSGQISPFLSTIGKSTLWMYKFFKPDYLIRETIRQQGIPEQYEALVHDDLRQGISPNFMRHFMTELAHWELPQQIHNRLLLVVGEKEPKAAFGFAKGYLRRYPNAYGVIVPGARHAWSLQFPELFAKMTRAWVTGQPLPEGFQKLASQ